MKALLVAPPCCTVCQDCRACVSKGWRLGGVTRANTFMYSSRGICLDVSSINIHFCECVQLEHLLQQERESLRRQRAALGGVPKVLLVIR